MILQECAHPIGRQALTGGEMTEVHRHLIRSPHGRKDASCCAEQQGSEGCAESEDECNHWDWGLYRLDCLDCLDALDYQEILDALDKDYRCKFTEYLSSEQIKWTVFAVGDIIWGDNGPF